MRKSLIAAQDVLRIDDQYGQAPAAEPDTKTMARLGLSGTGGGTPNGPQFSSEHSDY